MTDTPIPDVKHEAERPALIRARRLLTPEEQFVFTAGWHEARRWSIEDEKSRAFMDAIKAGEVEAPSSADLIHEKAAKAGQVTTDPTGFAPGPEGFTGLDSVFGYDIEDAPATRSTVEVPHDPSRLNVGGKVRHIKSGMVGTVVQWRDERDGGSGPFGWRVIWEHGQGEGFYDASELALVAAPPSYEDIEALRKPCEPCPELLELAEVEYVRPRIWPWVAGIAVAYILGKGARR